MKLVMHPTANELIYGECCRFSEVRSLTIFLWRFRGSASTPESGPLPVAHPMTHSPNFHHPADIENIKFGGTLQGRVCISE